jgi:hypothetical protein
MKKHIVLLGTCLIVLAGQASAQKYKTAADTVKLNKEYISLTEDIAELNADLITAREKLPGYQRKVEDKTSDARKAAVKSNEQSSKAIDGDVGDAKKAKKKANQALQDARDVEDANDKVRSQEKKIEKLEKGLQKKQERLQEVEQMKATILNASMK